MPQPHPELTLLYDGSCPICLGEMEALRQRDTHGRLAGIDVSALPAGASVLGVTREAAMQAMTGVHADGRVIRGVEVFRRSYALVSVTCVATITRLPLVAPVLEGLYPVFARHRQRLPNWLVRCLFGRALERARRHCRGTCPRP